MKFLERLELIVNSCTDLNLGEWKKNGTAFHIPNLIDFENNIRPYSIDTLKRQLNYYKFNIDYTDGMMFSHNNFSENVKTVINISRNVKNPKPHRKFNHVKRKIRHNNDTELEFDTLFRPISLLEKRIENIHKQIEKINKEIEEMTEMTETVVLRNENDPTLFLSVISPWPSICGSPCGSPVSF